MATIDDALRLVKADPVVGFVSIPIIAARPPRTSVLVKLKGQTLMLPDWNGSEWVWFGNLAFQIAALQQVNNSAGESDKKRALDRLRAIHPAMTVLASVKPDAKQASDYYVAAVKLVISSNAATTGPTRGDMAVQAFGSALKEAPFTILTALKDVLETAGDLFLKDLPREATRILKDLFGSTATAIFSGLGSFGPILLIGAGLWAISKMKE